jgi:hypothetical protein
VKGVGRKSAGLATPRQRRSTVNRQLGIRRFVNLPPYVLLEVVTVCFSTKNLLMGLYPNQHVAPTPLAMSRAPSRNFMRNINLLFGNNIG